MINVMFNFWKKAGWQSLANYQVITFGGQKRVPDLLPSFVFNF
jgi:hypothetical protein